MDTRRTNDNLYTVPPACTAFYTHQLLHNGGRSHRACLLANQQMVPTLAA